jgi:hypothetical protein
MVGIMKQFYWLIMLAVLLLFSGCVQPDKVKVTVKQIIPLPTGTLIEVAAPLEINQTLDSFLPRTGENSISENSSFVIPIELTNGDEDFSNTSIYLFFEQEYVEVLYPYSSSKKPLEQLGNNTYLFDNDLKATQSTRLLLVGKVKSLPPGTKYAGVSFNLTLFDGNKNVIGRAGDTIRIDKLYR